MQNKIEQVILDYQKRAKDMRELINSSTNSGSQNDIQKFARLNTKLSMYRELELDAWRSGGSQVPNVMGGDSGFIIDLGE